MSALAKTVRHVTPFNEFTNRYVLLLFLSSGNSCSHEIKKYEPVILHGRTPQEVPPQQLGPIKNYEVISSLTGPHGGLISVNQTEKHLSASDPEINFIDNLEDESGKSSFIENNINDIRVTRFYPVCD